MLEKNGTGQDKLGQVAGLKLMALRKKERARLLPRNLNAIFGENRTVECRGYPKAILFEVGGRCGNIVTKTTTKDVRLAWRVVAINGKEIASSTVREVLQATHRSSRKYTVTFRFGDKKDPEEEEGGDNEEGETARLREEEKVRLKVKAEEDARLQAEEKARLEAEEADMARAKKAAEREEKKAAAAAAAAAAA